MPRSVAVALLFVIFPSFAPAQEVEIGQGTTHEVVKGETLWALAGRYLGNPYRWPLIYEANTSQINDPDLIEPGQLLVIPVIGGDIAQVQGVTVVTGGGVPVAAEEVVTAGVGNWVQAGGVDDEVCPGSGERTVFYEGSGRRCAVVTPSEDQRTAFYTRPNAWSDIGGESPGAARRLAPEDGVMGIAVPYGLVYSSEWLDAPGVPDGSIGMLGEIPGIPANPIGLIPARAGDHVVIALENGMGLQVGDLLQSFRTIRKARKLGAVQRPTGILVVTGRNDAGIVAIVSSEYDRIWVGDKIRRAPEYSPRVGVFPLPVESNVTATVLGFPEERSMQGLGVSVFLDLGMNEGLAVGDIFRASVHQSGPFFGMEALTLQVVLVEASRSTARIITVKHPGLGSGDRLRLIAKMQ